MQKLLKGSWKRLLAISLCLVMLLPIVPTTLAGNIDPSSDARSVSEQIAGEGVVMLKNEDDLLPLDREKLISVFGIAQRNYIRGGTGSGSVNTYDELCVTLTRAMYDAGFNLDYETMKLYAKEAEQSAENWPLSGMTWSSRNATGGGAGGILEERDGKTVPQLNSGAPNLANGEEFRLSADQIAAAKARQAGNGAGNSTAVYIIHRTSAEGNDGRENQPAEDAPAGEKADSYWLTHQEQDNIDAICKEFDNVILVLNIGRFVDLQYVNSFPNIKAILIPWEPGTYGFKATGEILAGDYYPSGKLTDTYAYDLFDYPARKWGNKYGRLEANPIYKEDIYVGYRYFETFAPEDVMYPFGYGLTYADFDIETLDVKSNRASVDVTVKVTNTSDTYSGKEVVQVYYGAPQGVLGNPVKELAAYAKTDELAPGKSQTIELSYKTKDMASYDDLGLTGNKSCWVMEAGDYNIYVGNNVRVAEKVGVYKLDALRVTEVCSEAMTPISDSLGFAMGTTSTTGLTNAGSDRRAGNAPDRNSQDWDKLVPGEQNDDGTYQETFTPIFTRTHAEMNEIMNADRKAKGYLDENKGWVELNYKEEYEGTPQISYLDVLKANEGKPKDEWNWDPFLSQIKMMDVISLFGNSTNMGTNKTYDDLNAAQKKQLDFLYSTTVGNQTPTNISVAYYHSLFTQGSAGWSGVRGAHTTQNFGGTDHDLMRKGTSDLERFGIPCISMIDGPAGARVQTHQNAAEKQTGTTWFPMGYLRASSWNYDLQVAVGYEIGLEMVYNDCDMWLAPGMDIHRDPLCGRNFEYYSEDPLLSGNTAAAESIGVQKAGPIVTLKHYVSNDQEFARQGGNSQLTERALREIYLKNFEIAIKRANPGSIMTTYGKVNGYHTQTSYGLCQQITRDEWGWEGYYVSDWGAGKDFRSENPDNGFADNFLASSGNANLVVAGHDMSTQYSVSGLMSGYDSGGARGTHPAGTVEFPLPKETGTYSNRGTVAGVPNRYMPDDVGTTAETYEPGYDTSKYYIKNNPDGVASFYTVPGIGGDKFVCTVNDAVNNDYASILRPLLYGELTMGELQRNVKNILYGFATNVYYRGKIWNIGLKPIPANEDEAMFTVAKLTSEKSTLQQVIDYADAQMAMPSYKNVIASVRANFEASLERALAVNNNSYATEAEIYEAWTDLLQWIQALDMVEGDKQLLSEAINAANSINLKDYIARGQARFTKALAYAKEVYENPPVSQLEIDEATTELINSMLALRFKADTSILEQLLASAKALKLSRWYTTNSVLSFTKAIEAAEMIIEQDLSENDQNLIDNAAAALQSAIDGLSYIRLFNDVEPNDWYYDYIMTANADGLMIGLGNSIFAPQDELNRAMVVQVLYNMEGKPSVKDDSSMFTDVSGGHWASYAVKWASNAGIVKGYGDGKFGPDDSIKRQDFAAILHRYAEYKGYDTTVPSDFNLAKYTDASEISGYAAETMRWAVYTGLITGRTDTTLVPLGTTTRAECATLLTRYTDKIVP